MGDARLLASGERVLLIDAKQRRYLLKLRAGDAFHTHAGILAHDDVIGVSEGTTVLGSTGREFLVFRPTLADVVIKMPRGAQVIYPKDLGAILMAADVGPGQRILEAGVGSGALSMALLRAGATVIGYEIREDFATHARSNVVAQLGEDVDYSIEVRDVTEGIAEADLDRVILDLPEPWAVVPHAAVGATSRRHPALLPPDHQPDHPAARRAGEERLRPGRDGRDPAADLARRAPVGPARPPHGGPHRLPDHGAAAGPEGLRVERTATGAAARQSRSMKMHSPGHSSEASTTASSSSSGTSAMPAEPPGSFLMASPSFT